MYGNQSQQPGMLGCCLQERCVQSTGVGTCPCRVRWQLGGVSDPIATQVARPLGLGHGSPPPTADNPFLLRGEMEMEMEMELGEMLAKPRTGEEGAGTIREAHEQCPFCNAPNFLSRVCFRVGKLFWSNTRVCRQDHWQWCTPNTVAPGTRTETRTAPLVLSRECTVGCTLGPLFAMAHSVPRSRSHAFRYLAQCVWNTRGECSDHRGGCTWCGAHPGTQKGTRMVGWWWSCRERVWLVVVVVVESHFRHHHPHHHHHHHHLHLAEALCCWCHPAHGAAGWHHHAGSATHPGLILQAARCVR
jgi:hypothetical protein